MLRDAFRMSMQPPGGGLWYYWQGNNLLTSTVPVYIDLPDKWQDTSPSWKRSADRRGLIRTLSAPYEFVNDSARMIRYMNYTGSIQSVIIFTIEKRNYSTGAYEVFFSGQVDLSTALDGVKYSNGSVAISAAIIEGGVGAMIDAAGSTPYEITLDPTDADHINMDGIELREVDNYAPLGLTFQNRVNRGAIIPSAFTVTEGSFPTGPTQGQTLNEFDPSNPLPDLQFGDFAKRATTALSTTLEGVLVFDFIKLHAGNDQCKIEAFVADATKAITQTFLLYTSPVVTGFATQQQYVAFSQAITMNLEDRLYLVVTSLSGLTNGFQFYSRDDYFYKLSSTFRLPGSLCYSYRYAVLIEKLLFQITGQTGILQSDFFTNQNARYNDCNPYNVRLTCGDALRNLTTNAAGVSQTPAIRISWVDLWNDMRRRFGLGMDIRNGKVVIERAAFFFDQNSIIADVGEVSEMTTGWATDYFFNSGKWGYPTQTYDQLNGRDEPNTTSIFKYPLTFIRTTGNSTQGSLEDNTCPIRSDMYGIEGARVNLSQKKTTDAASDNDTFAIETEANTSAITTFTTVFIGGVPVANPVIYTVYNLYRPQNIYTQPAVTGLLFPSTTYNLTMTPVRLFRNSGDTTRGMLYHLDGDYITFQTGDKNTFVNVNCGAGPIAENADIRVSDLDAPYMKPRVSHITCILPTTFAAALERNRSGCIQYSENGAIFKGFPMEVMVKGATDNSYNITVLWTTDTDETPLMNA